MFVKKIMLFAVLFSPFFMTAQEDSLTSIPKNEIGITPFSVENNSVTVNMRVISPLFHVGAYYSRNIGQGNWTFRTQIRYGENTIEDDCKDCADHLYGRGALNNLLVTSGFRYSFLKENQIFIQPFIQLNILYNYLRYSGTFQGGFSGGIHFKDEIIHGVGGSVTSGITFLMGDHFTATLQSSFRIYFGAIQNGYSEKFYGLEGVNQPVGLKFGYRF